jgi:hypothetical protein
MGGFEYFTGQRQKLHVKNDMKALNLLEYWKVAA